MYQQKLLFIDRDGTLIREPEDKQIDSMEKFFLMPYVIPALLQLKSAGYQFVMVSNQDGLGSIEYPQIKFDNIQKFLLNILDSQGIQFKSIHICPHVDQDCCECRKPRVGLILDYLADQSIDIFNSYIIGDRETDHIFAKNMGLKGIQIGSPSSPSWKEITENILFSRRQAKVIRKTSETEINMAINLDIKDLYSVQKNVINTGIGFFDHMLMQLAKHGGFKLDLDIVQSDLHIDEHHTVEDTALVLGEALTQALGDRYGIARYGFILPMDEALAEISLDLSGRPYFKFEGEFQREYINDFPTELVSHFFRSLTDTLKAALHIKIKGENTHHMIEAIFKGLGRTLRQAISQIDKDIPSTKGIL